jgi:hypothetical protein
MSHLDENENVVEVGELFGGEKMSGVPRRFPWPHRQPRACPSVAMSIFSRRGVCVWFAVAAALTAFTGRRVAIGPSAPADSQPSRRRAK